MNKKDEDRTVVKVAAIQGNVNMDAVGSAIYELMEVYGDMTREAAEEGADIVVWPESIFPFKLNRYSILQEFVSSLAVECNVTLIVGALYGDADGKTYNTLYMVTPDGSISDNLYHKRHLVPFGEYVPMRKVFMTLIPPLAELSALDDDLSPGDETALFDTKWGKLGSLICFDSIYEELTRASVRDGANLMMLPSNDSWWFTTSVETYQNETQAMLRAIESGRYLVRAGNTGISSIITEHGEHKAWLAPETKGIAVSEVEMCTHTTLYARVGNLLVYLCIAFVLILYPLDFLIEKRKKKNQI
jgi:apolipoprotein N-acyltransferase